ncbi:zinc-binding dehydrogenase [Streptomyces sp. ODS05-4]|uniref:zinc-dependent alcohol dehydrogenase n=1 Tax=Streptomyces sp. ODS05-4 TaxID=2944939 RepID=UPI00210D520F|nr:alcohol dehydrogenase catalytic domain-containing protein [Streptomyces sp. ODS05-4]
MEWREQRLPPVLPETAALVRPVAVATCDLDGRLLRGETPAAAPFPVGHEFVAEVVETGAGVAGVAPGQMVCVPFQINCGDCRACRAGRSGRCTAVAPGSAYGMGALSDGLTWGGAVADRVLVPFADAMCVAAPDGLDPALLTGLSDNLVDGWRTVAPHLGEALEPTVLVIGAGWVGLYATAVAVALGARVTYADPDEERCRTAEGLGAVVFHEEPRPRYSSHCVVASTDGTEAGLQTALRSTASGGVCTDTGIYFPNLMRLPLLEMYSKGVTLRTGRIDARSAMPAVLELLREGVLDTAPLEPEAVSWESAPEAWGEHRGRMLLTRP